MDHDDAIKAEKQGSPKDSPQPGEDTTRNYVGIRKDTSKS